MEQGWIKLHRELLDNPVVTKDNDYLAVWIYLLLEATHSEVKRDFNGEFITLKKGQLITGRKSINSILKISESKIQRILKTFESEQQIEQQTNGKGRLISILNWDKYQKSEQQIEQQVNSERTTSEQRVNTNKNVKNVNNEIIKDSSDQQQKYLEFGVAANSNGANTKPVRTQDEYFNQWNSLGIKPINAITSKRKAMLNARIKEYGEDSFYKCIENIKNSNFLRGQSKNGWIITFDWLIKPNNYIKVLENQYADNMNNENLIQKSYVNTPSLTGKELEEFILNKNDLDNF